MGTHLLLESGTPSVKLTDHSVKGYQFKVCKLEKSIWSCPQLYLLKCDQSWLMCQCCTMLDQVNGIAASGFSTVGQVASIDKLGAHHLPLSKCQPRHYLCDRERARERMGERATLSSIYNHLDYGGQGWWLWPHKCHCLDCLLECLVTTNPLWPIRWFNPVWVAPNQTCSYLLDFHFILPLSGHTKNSVEMKWIWKGY